MLRTPLGHFVPGGFGKARTVATLGEAARITDYISLGLITSAFPEKAIRTALAETGRSSVRERELPAQVVMYYVIAQALVYAGFTAGGVAMSAGRSALVVWSVGSDQGDRQIRHFASKEPIGLGAGQNSYMTQWSHRLRSSRRAGLGTGIGGWSAWTAAR
jgi:hypothetical protein